MCPKSRSDFTIAIICALTLEADAVEALFDEHYDRLGEYYGKQPGDTNAYINGRIGNHNVVLCYMPGIGKESAASVASSLQVSYTGIKLALVVGICGGAPSPPNYQEIFLGDVIISDSVIEYDFGRQYPGGFQQKTAVKDMLGRPSQEIRALLNGLRAENARNEFQSQIREYLHVLQQRGTKWDRPDIKDILFDASYLHKHHSDAPAGCSCFRSNSPDEICEMALEEDCDSLGCDKSQAVRCQKTSENIQPSVYIGPIASADTVMKSGQYRDELVRKEKVIGFEMEGAGVWDNLPCIIIKGVCDYADSHKSKSWQAYAAATGASAAKAFLKYWMPANRKGASRSRYRHLMIPFGRNSRFVGRQDEIRKLEDLIFMPDGPRKLAIAGLGGVGKTQVALELAYRMRDRKADCSIFWVPCTSYEVAEQAFLSIAQRVEIQDTQPAKLKERLKAYFGQEDKKWLLIFDNADDMDMWTKGSNDTPPLKDFLPLNNQGHIIFTTRNRELAVDLASSYVIQVRELDRKTGMEFLEKSLCKDLLHDSHAMIRLLEQLTFLPLAISQATAYINKKGLTVSDYLTLLEEQETDVVELLSKDFGDDQRYTDVQNPVATTWLISFKQVQKLDQLAVEYLLLMACINPRNIPQTFLPPRSKLQMSDALGLLNAFFFITIQPGNGYISLHRLVHRATRNWMRKEEWFPLWITKAADRLSSIFPHNDYTNRQVWREYLPHALSLLGEVEFHKHQEQYVDYIEKVGTCLDSDGRYNEAEKLQAQVIETRKKVLGLEHSSTLTSMHNLASTYRNQGRWREAEELQEQVIKTWKQVLGPKHPFTLTSMGNLALIYWNRGRWKKAEELLAQVMENRKQVLGLEHPDTLASVHNLAATYLDRGRWKEAEELFVQLVETRKQVVGLEHPDTLTSMHNLASTYRNQGRWKEAEGLLTHILEAWKRVVGSEHPSTLTSMHNLASVFWCQGRWKEAEELLTEVIGIRKQVLGPEHPDTLASLHNLASRYLDIGYWKEAEGLLAQVMETRKQVLGPAHPSTLTCMHNLASTYQNQGRLKEAEELQVRVMEAWKQVVGSKHPSTLTSMGNLASTYRNQGRWKEAEELQVQVMETWRQVLGPEHPDTLISMANLALLYYNQGRWDKAEKLQVQVMETRKQVLGPEHPHTLTSMLNLAFTLKNLGRNLDALRLIKDYAGLCNKVLGSNHPQAILSLSTLNEWETEVDQLTKGQKQQTLAGTSSLALPQSYVGEQVASNLKPAGGKRRRLS
ncbi:hypothetical protein BDW60DRAFT_207169 [Aspergillus nidulans var. acristatus]